MRGAEHLSAGVDPLGPHREGEIALRTLMIETQPPPNAYEYVIGVLQHILGRDRANARAVLSRCSDELLICAVGILQKHLPELERLADRLQTKGEITI